ncbi:hypothetical protein B2J88_35745 [Rhodococcus sp. SRB_17]|nr:hypothetical protein [Rhodococcus sp. SRB_17]
MKTTRTIEFPESAIEFIRELIRPIVIEVMQELVREGQAASVVNGTTNGLSIKDSSRGPSSPDGCLNIHEVSARTGHTPQRIRNLRVEGHDLYSLAWKNGDARNSHLIFDEQDVDAWVARRHKAR